MLPYRVDQLEFRKIIEKKMKNRQIAVGDAYMDIKKAQK